MTEVAAATPAPDPPRTQEELTAAQNVLLDRLTVLLEDNAALARRAGAAAVGPEIAMALDRGWHRVADVQGELRELRAEGRRKLARRSLAQAWEIMQPDLAPAPAPVPPPRSRRRSGSHRARNPDQPPLWGLPGWVAVPLGATGAALRHSWAAHPVATAVAGTAAVATLTAGAVVVPHTAATFGLGGTTASAPSTGITSAIPIISPSQIAAVIHPKGGTGTALTVVAPPSVPSYVLAGPPPPDSGGDPGSQQQSQVPLPQVKLVVTGSLDLGLGSSGTIRLTAFGGPVDWSATTSVAGLDLDVASGSLAAGDSATIGISLTADLQALAGPGSVTITYGDGKTAVVKVDWTVVPLPLPSLPDPVPSAVASILPGVLGS